MKNPRIKYGILGLMLVAGSGLPGCAGTGVERQPDNGGAERYPGPIIEDRYPENKVGRFGDRYPR